MIGKFVVIDTLDNFKSKLSSIPSSAIVLIKDVGQIYAHGTYFGGQTTQKLLDQQNAGLAPAGGVNPNGQISDADSEWVLTVTEGKDPAWKKLPANAFSSGSFALEAATKDSLGGIKVGSVYNGLFSTLTGQHYTVNVDKSGLAYVSVPWEKRSDQKVKQTPTSELNEDFRILFSYTSDDELRTEEARKASNLKFNPYTGTLKADAFSGTAAKVTVGNSTEDNYRAIVVTNGSNALYTAGTAAGKPKYNYKTGDVKAASFTTDGGNFNGNATSASDADKIDGYHLAVVTSAGTDTSTIYFVT